MSRRPHLRTRRGGPRGPAGPPCAGIPLLPGSGLGCTEFGPSFSFLLFHFCNSSELNSAAFSRPGPAPSLLKVVSPPAQALKGEAEVRGEAHTGVQIEGGICLQADHPSPQVPAMPCAPAIPGDSQDTELRKAPLQIINFFFFK